MDAKDKVPVIQSNIDALRKEIDLRIESQNNLWRVVIAGLAAVVVLKSDIDVGRFLPVVPIVGMLITAYWLGESLFVFRTGRWIATMEAMFCDTNQRCGNSGKRHYGEVTGSILHSR